MGKTSCVFEISSIFLAKRHKLPTGKFSKNGLRQRSDPNYARKLWKSGKSLHNFAPGKFSLAAAKKMSTSRAGKILWLHKVNFFLPFEFQIRRLHVSSSRAAAAAKVKEFQIYRWNPDKPEEKPFVQVSADTYDVANYTLYILCYFVDVQGRSWHMWSYGIGCLD